MFFLNICLQRNQAGSSPAMEFLAFKQCMEFLIAYGLTIATFISDRHVSIASHMKTVLSHIVHYFDIWHLKKSKIDFIFSINFCLSYVQLTTGVIV